MTDTDMSSEKVLPLLNAILALPSNQRLGLFQAWTAMDPAVLSKQETTTEIDADEHLRTSQNELNSWLEGISKLEPKLRVAALQKAIDHEEVIWIIDLLQAELDRVKNSNPWLAVERAVVKYAYEHPVLMFVALLGLFFSIYRMGKAVFTVVF